MDGSEDGPPLESARSVVRPVPPTGRWQENDPFREEVLDKLAQVNKRLHGMDRNAALRERAVMRRETALREAWEYQERLQWDQSLPKPSKDPFRGVTPQLPPASPPGRRTGEQPRTAFAVRSAMRTAPDLSSTAPPGGASFALPNVRRTAGFAEHLREEFPHSPPTTVRSYMFGTTTSPKDERRARTAVPPRDVLIKKAEMNRLINLEMKRNAKRIVASRAGALRDSLMDHGCRVYARQVTPWSRMKFPGPMSHKIKRSVEAQVLRRITAEIDRMRLERWGVDQLRDEALESVHQELERLRLAAEDGEDDDHSDVGSRDLQHQSPPPSRPAARGARSVRMAVDDKEDGGAAGRTATRRTLPSVASGSRKMLEHAVASVKGGLGLARAPGPARSVRNSSVGPGLTRRERMKTNVSAVTMGGDEAEGDRAPHFRLGRSVRVRPDDDVGGRSTPDDLSFEDVDAGGEAGDFGAIQGEFAAELVPERVQLVVGELAQDERFLAVRLVPAGVNPESAATVDSPRPGPGRNFEEAILGTDRAGHYFLRADWQSASQERSMGGTGNFGPRRSMMASMPGILTDDITRTYIKPYIKGAVLRLDPSVPHSAVSLDLSGIDLDMLLARDQRVIQRFEICLQMAHNARMVSLAGNSLMAKPLSALLHAVHARGTAPLLQVLDLSDNHIGDQEEFGVFDRDEETERREAEVPRRGKGTRAVIGNQDMRDALHSAGLLLGRGPDTDWRAGRLGHRTLQGLTGKNRPLGTAGLGDFAWLEGLELSGGGVGGGGVGMGRAVSPARRFARLDPAPAMVVLCDFLAAEAELYEAKAYSDDESVAWEGVDREKLRARKQSIAWKNALIASKFRGALKALKSLKRANEGRAGGGTWLSDSADESDSEPEFDALLSKGPPAEETPGDSGRAPSVPDDGSDDVYATRATVSVPAGRISQLILRGNRISDAATVSLLCRTVVQCRMLREVDLSRNAIADSSMEALAGMVRSCPHIVALNLASNDIGSRGASLLAAAAMDSRTLSAVDLSNNRIGNAGAAAWAEVLSTSLSLEELHVASCGIGDDGCMELGAALHPEVGSVASVLNMSGQTFGVRGIELLREVVRDRELAGEPPAAIVARGLDVENLLSAVRRAEMVRNTSSMSRGPERAQSRKVSSQLGRLASRLSGAGVDARRGNRPSLLTGTGTGW
ncbi:unnamed protein product [Pedinophyceae sp. YPF-701]|nr:unnamed protein product [Pedinophyceae sp. YPF-701]